MIHKTPAPRPGYVRVVFELPSCVWADRISVAGTFNGWDSTALPMRQDRDGVWRASVELESGRRHEFRYQIDGRWQTDYHADGFKDNDYGTHNSILDLEHFVTAEDVTGLSASVPEGNPGITGATEVSGSQRRTLDRGLGDLSRVRPRVAAA